MDSDPVTLGDWYEILKVADYAEAAMLANQGRSPPTWIPTFLMHWAPELIMGRKKLDRSQNRKFVVDQLAKIDAAAQQITGAMNSEIIKFLQLPPYGPFDSELGTHTFVSSLGIRAGTP